MFPTGPVEFGMREMQAHASCSSNTFCGGAWTHLPGVPLPSQQCRGQAPPAVYVESLAFNSRKRSILCSSTGEAWRLWEDAVQASGS